MDHVRGQTLAPVHGIQHPREEARRTFFLSLPRFLLSLSMSQNLTWNCYCNCKSGVCPFLSRGRPGRVLRTIYPLYNITLSLLLRRSAEIRLERLGKASGCQLLLNGKFPKVAPHKRHSKKWSPSVWADNFSLKSWPQNRYRMKVWLKWTFDTEARLSKMI